MHLLHDDLPEQCQVISGKEVKQKTEEVVRYGDVFDLDGSHAFQFDPSEHVNHSGKSDIFANQFDFKATGLTQADRAS